MKLSFSIKLIVQGILILNFAFIITSCEQRADDSAIQQDAFVVNCKDFPIPEFTLDYESNPSLEEVSALCICIWEELGDWERSTAKAYYEGRESDVSALHAGGFPSRFRSAFEKCGGFDL